jgi:multidrug transporter EmrE-like cation transporter
VVFGITNFVFKIQRELIPLENPYHFLTIIFPAAFLVSGIVVIRQKVVFTKIVVGLGIVLGVINLFSSYFFMKALQNFSGIVVYPINGIGIILGSALTSIFLWKERLTGTNYIFIALASLALLMIYPR